LATIGLSFESMLRSLVIMDEEIAASHPTFFSRLFSRRACAIGTATDRRGGAIGESPGWYE